MRLTTGRKPLCALVFFATVVLAAPGQQFSKPGLQRGEVTGTVTDMNDGIIPGAEVLLQSPASGEMRSVTSADDGSFNFPDLQPGVAYRMTISAPGFVTWISPEIIVGPGQVELVTGSKLRFSGEAASVTVYASSEEVAAEQLKIEERQRVFGIIPNFYVAYNRDAVPLTPKLKFRLAWKATTDPVFFGAIALTAALDQAGDTPDYGQGARGYGQRAGALFANGFTDIMVGEAILPSLLHQDPRYFYQGTGTKRSRVFHAISNAFLCKGDNGRWQPNYSSIGGDLAAGALSNIYYPRANRGAGLVFENALITTGGRMANGLVQEFVLRRFTSNARVQNP